MSFGFGFFLAAGVSSVPAVAAIPPERATTRAAISSATSAGRLCTAPPQVDSNALALVYRREGLVQAAVTVLARLWRNFGRNPRSYHASGEPTNS
jgi:hypothetical protein